MTVPPSLQRVLRRLQSRLQSWLVTFRAAPMRVRAGAGGLVAALLVAAVAVSVVSGAPEAPPVAVVIETATPTPSPTPTRRPTRTPTPTPTPTPEERVEAAAFANPTSLSFPPPPAKHIESPPNAGGIVRMVSEDFQLDHYVDVLGITDNQMDAPDNDGSYAVGWYPDFGKPGDGGNAVFSAHESWQKMQGPFYHLHKAEPGDEIVLEMADGRRLRYEVLSFERYTLETIPMAEVLWPTNKPAGEEWITLITCGGRIVYDGDYGEYLDRDVIIAKLVE